MGINPSTFNVKFDLTADRINVINVLEPNIPGYEIIEQCGDGSTAKVHVATQTSLGRKVALKVMLSALSEDKFSTDRFIKEGLINAKLIHPNIVTIYDVGATDSCHYIAMEYLSGSSLRKKLHKRLELNWILSVAEQIARALSYAHKNGFVHRDIKPENILFRDDNTAVLTDFGIATVLDSHIQITDRCNFGTPRYMSPEEINATTVGSGSDVYSLGVVLYEMLTGLPPYNDGDSNSIRYAHLHNSVPELPYKYKSLQPLINKMLAKRVEDRIIDANGVADILVKLKSNIVTTPTFQATNDSKQKRLSNYKQWLLNFIYLITDTTKRFVKNINNYSVRLLKNIIGKIELVFNNKLKKNKFVNELIPVLKSTTSLSVFFGLVSLLLSLIYINDTLKFEQLNVFKNHLISESHYQLGTANIVNLLSKAELQVINNNLTIPPDNNAYDTYRQILKYAPDNPDALAGINKIKQRYTDWAEQDIKKNNYKRAVLLYKKALAIDPNDLQLIQLIRKLKLKNIQANL